jgi:hypothetical protein
MYIIQMLFQGVQLNINNPNLLITQGHITKVHLPGLPQHINQHLDFYLFLPFPFPAGPQHVATGDPWDG